MPAAENWFVFKIILNEMHRFWPVMTAVQNCFVFERMPEEKQLILDSHTSGSELWFVLKTDPFGPRRVQGPREAEFPPPGSVPEIDRFRLRFVLKSIGNGPRSVPGATGSSIFSSRLGAGN